MSGGVDSSVAAHLLRAAGHDVIGVFMRHGEPVAVELRERKAQRRIAACRSCAARAGHKQGCCSASDAQDARRVADRLDIPFYAIDFQEEFSQIIDYFIDEYTAARTPNPCVMCNNWIKFGRLFEYADSVGAEFVATGHYAQLRPAAASEGLPGLCRGVDPLKDQSYVLFGIDRRLLGRMLLPVGGYRKEEIRRMAHELGLARGGQERQSGNLFRSRWRPRGVHSPQAGRVAHRRRGGDHRRARSSARTTDWKSSRSDSGKVWASRWASRVS